MTMTTIDARCGVSTCSKNVYRMVGRCDNCMAEPLLILFSEGHDTHPARCTVCGVNRVRAIRQATTDEIPEAQ